MTARRVTFILALLIVVSTAAALPAAAQPPSGLQMPDPKEISGVPLPVADIPAGTVTIRVIRGSFSNPVAGQKVELTGADTPRTATTDAGGRAEFSGLAIGTRLTADTIVDGEKIVSQAFEVPAQGGIRLMLVATDPDAARKAEEARKLAEGPAQPGIVVLGGQSRFVLELGDDGVNVFNIVQVQNTARVPVQPPSPVVFDVPAAAKGTSILEGSSPKATVAGTRVTVAGPFPPGQTLVQFAYTMPYGADTMTIAQRLPAALAQVTVLAQKAGGMQLTSPQLAQQREMSADNQSYIVGQGPALRAGDQLVLTLSGLPYHPAWPKNLALTLAVIVLAGGLWGAVVRGRGTVAARRRGLEAERDRLFAELTAIETQRRTGTLDPSVYEARRRELVATLEGIYAAIDREAA